MTVWNALYKAALGILALLGLVAVGYAFHGPIKERDHLLGQKKDLAAAVQRERDKLDDLKQRQERLLTDPRFVEKIAREEFGYARPGEIVFKFEGDATVRPRRN